MNIQHELRLRTAYSSLKEIALVIGYPARQAGKAANRIHRVITSETLGLDSGNYDFKYSDAEFVLKLCQVLGMDTDECACQVEKISADLLDWTLAYKPWLYVDTGFHRTTEPIHALAFMENQRRILLPEFARFPLYQQLDQVKLLIIQHYEDNDGRLPLWGSIQRYKYFYHENQSITFDTDGHVVESRESSVQPAATISINGKDLRPIIQV